MFTIYTTSTFDTWFKKLKDSQGKKRIQARIDRLEDGHLGDVKTISDKMFELRFFFSPGYRVYCYQQGQQIIVLLAGGDKSSQSKDIKNALQLIEQLQEGQ